MSAGVTSGTHPPRRLGRGAGAVLAGFLAVIVLSLGTDAALFATGIFPPRGQPMSDALYLLATAYRTIYGIAGSYIMARLAPDRPMGHALAGGVIGLAVSTAGAIATWGSVPGPRWYPLALIATAMPIAWAGGKLRVLQMPLATLFLTPRQCALHQYPPKATVDITQVLQTAGERPGRLDGYRLFHT